MITIISGTNRPNSMTLKVSNIYFSILKDAGLAVNLLSLENLNVWEKNSQLHEVMQDVLIPTEKFIIVMPEYNGSFPGILKLLFDNSDIKKCWWHKKAALVGVADGRGGNLRGIEHMTNILHYLKVNVHYNKLPLSKINEELSSEGVLLQSNTEIAIRNQIEEFLNY